MTSTIFSSRLLRNDAWRKLRKKDAARIKCQGAQALSPSCPNNAAWCHTVEWNTGNTTGISFFYLCSGCKGEKG